MIKFGSVFQLLAKLLAFFATALLLPIFVELIYQDGSVIPYLITMLSLYVLSLILWGVNKNSNQQLIHKESFVFTLLAWILIIIFAAMPFWLGIENLNYYDALFESASGLTTTGAEVFANLDDLSHSLLFYHQYLQFLGGMGVIVLAVAILPSLSMGRQTISLDAPNAMIADKFTPKIINTAKILWGLYVLFAVVCCYCYWFFGMTWFDAVCEAFATISTGGFSIHNYSFAKYNSSGIIWTAIVFMLIGAIGFNLHFKAIVQNNWRSYFLNKEVKLMAVSILILTLIIMLTLINYNFAIWNVTTIEQSVFTSMAFITTTGFEITDSTVWPQFLILLIVLFGLIGGCSGSTSGGLKLKRVLIIYYEAVHSFKRLLHPQAVFASDANIDYHSHYGFLSMFLIVYILLLFIFMLLGYSVDIAFASVTACLSNVGATIGDVANDYASMSIAAKAVLIIAMIAGRLEIMIFFVCFTPLFWSEP